MINVSSQDFRNLYEKFYNSIRNYLWPFQTLQVLSDVEVDIYSAFIDIDKLKIDLDKLYRSIKDIMKDDEELSSNYNDIVDLANDESASTYLRLMKINEVNPEKEKQIRTISEESEEAES